MSVLHQKPCRHGADLVNLRANTFPRLPNSALANDFAGLFLRCIRKRHDIGGRSDIEAALLAVDVLAVSQKGEAVFLVRSSMVRGEEDERHTVQSRAFPRVVKQDSDVAIATIFGECEDKSDPRRHVRRGDAVQVGQRQKRNDRLAVQQEEEPSLSAEGFRKRPIFQQAQKVFGGFPVASAQRMEQQLLRGFVRFKKLDYLHDSFVI